MPAPWLTVLQSVPWSDVIRNAPKVADGARKLWNAVAKKPPQDESVVEPTTAAAAPQADSVAALHARCEAMEGAIADLDAQMLASSELIKALADQNAQLVQRIESNRVRWSWLLAAVAVVGVVALAALVWIGRHAHV